MILAKVVASQNSSVVSNSEEVLHSTLLTNHDRRKYCLPMVRAGKADTRGRGTDEGLTFKLTQPFGELA